MILPSVRPSVTVRLGNIISYFNETED